MAPVGADLKKHVSERLWTDTVREKLRPLLWDSLVPKGYHPSHIITVGREKAKGERLEEMIKTANCMCSKFISLFFF